MTTSDGPAMLSIPTSPNTIFFATVTYIFPGPTILSTDGIVLVPYVRLAIAWAPPILSILSTLHKSAATIAKAWSSIELIGHDIMIDFTPATFAGITFIKTVEGYDAFPAGT